MGQIAFKFLVGAIAGLLAWMVIEPTAPSNPYGEAWGLFEIRMIAMLGLLVGLTIGGVNGWLQGSRLHSLRGLLLGGLFGAAGAYAGYVVGGTLASSMFGSDVFDHPNPGMIPARVLVGIGLGGGIGCGIGASGLTLRRTIQGLIGGVLGGAIGGALFDAVSLALSGFALALKGSSTTEAGQPGRAVLCILIGAGVGLLIGIVERVARVAWVRLNLGRNEGKEWVLDQHTSHIGRDERAQVPLFGDPNVAPLHCSIVRQGDAYWLYDAGTPMGTYINGQRIGQAPLMPGAIIQVGQFPLEFQLRAGSAPARAAERMRGQPVPMMPVQQPMPVQPAPAPIPTPVVSPGPALVGVTGPAAGSRFPIAGAMDIGREAAGIKLADTQASRLHARISMSPRGAMIEDLDSTNGTFVNGDRIRVRDLMPGDEIRIGQSVLRYEA